MAGGRRGRRFMRPPPARCHSPEGLAIQVPPARGRVESLPFSHVLPSLNSANRLIRSTGFGFLLFLFRYLFLLLQLLRQGQQGRQAVSLRGAGPQALVKLFCHPRMANRPAFTACPIDSLYGEPAAARCFQPAPGTKGSVSSLTVVPPFLSATPTVP
ncbi:hypothetical protein BDY21DRAFT_335744 [Lineolata rhizophorae]|uniref:Uncharacterized protein n=1 Tax=Lineolata rhizophorae TaxID=578093 RepID=A0A6A6P9I8_9PEZI|nr:hypothetical protein BDY21DRAFT_335744 [Lineolata rhizophorae]